MDALSELKHKSIAELERIIDRYPWFSVARKELFLKMSAKGEEYRMDALSRSVLYLYPDFSIFRDGYILASRTLKDTDLEQEERIYELDLGELQFAATPPAVQFVPQPTPQPEVQFAAVQPAPPQVGLQPASPQPEAEDEVVRVEPVKREVRIVGGDYFMPEDLKKVNSQDWGTLSAPARDPQGEEKWSSDGIDLSEELFFTETLAKIYADQEFYDLANEVYDKLILLYPEKSAYFASLKKETKKS